jgi:DNA polymerase-3 subunit gamma/tau
MKPVETVATPLKSTFKIPSLKSLKENIAEIPATISETQANTGSQIRNDPFTRQQVIDVWKEYTALLREQGKRSETIIIDRELTFKQDHIILLKLDNLVQEDVLNSIKPDLLEFVRSKINNSGIQLESEIIKDEAVKMMYTSNDRFRYLSEKYPLLVEMKKRFGLDTDF